MMSVYVVLVVVLQLPTKQFALHYRTSKLDGGTAQCRHRYLERICSQPCSWNYLQEIRWSVFQGQGYSLALIVKDIFTE